MCASPREQVKTEKKGGFEQKIEVRYTSWSYFLGIKKKNNEIRGVSRFAKDNLNYRFFKIS